MLERSRILVVEDNIRTEHCVPTSYQKVKKAIADFASDGEQGFELAMHNNFDAIV
ncbi:hypothetical protein O9993_15755 [Vibrio lentus]|nr:hypothetical protein [Vibrio lentus]